MSTPSPTVPKHAPGYTANDLGDELILLDGEQRRVLVLSETAREVYLLCDGTRTVEEVGREIVGRFDVDDRAAVSDSREAISRMLELGILVPN